MDGAGEHLTLSEDGEAVVEVGHVVLGGLVHCFQGFVVLQIARVTRKLDTLRGLTVSALATE